VWIDFHLTHNKDDDASHIDQIAFILFFSDIVENLFVLIIH